MRESDTTGTEIAESSSAETDKAIAQYLAKSKKDDPGPDAYPYQPECNTSNLREFLNKHASTLFWVTLVSPLAGCVYFAWAFLIAAMDRAPGMGHTGAFFFAAGPYLSLIILPVTFMISIRLFKIVFQPTHLLMRPDGLFIQWQQRLKRPIKPLILWSDLTYIDLEQVENKTQDKEQFVVFKTRKETPKGKEKRIKISGFVNSDGRTALLKAIRDYAAETPRNPELSTLLEPAPESSYTELWLTALSAPPERESLSPLEAGTLLKNTYKITRKIAMGGQGTAYVAIDGRSKDDKSEFVLKEYILPTQVGTKAKSQSIETLRNEAEILSKLQHKNIVQLKEYFVQDHRGYLVLEHVQGKNLREIVAERGALPENEIIQLALQMCDTLSYLHSQDPCVVHRDFTPDNLILTADGSLKLIDFNVARQSSSTVTATVVGKHTYISLEQFRGKPTAQSDIYSMGCILNFLATGQDPEPLTTSSPIHTRNELSAEFNTIVERATEIEAKFRYANAETLKQDLLNVPAGTESMTSGSEPGSAGVPAASSSDGSDPQAV